MILTATYLSGLLTILNETLFAHELKRIKKTYQELVRKNDRLRTSQNQDKQYGFIFDGVNYRDEEATVFYRNLPPLEMVLFPEMDAALADAKTIFLDKQRVGQALHQILSNSDSLQDIRDGLHEALIPLLGSDFRNLHRTREEAWNLEGRAKAQYLKLRPKIEFYTSTRLLY